MTQPQPMIVPVPQISWTMGLPPFIRLSDIYTVPGIDMFEVTCITDAPCMLQLSWERVNPPADPGGVPLTGTVEDVGPVTNHRLSVPDGSIAQQPRQQIAQEIRFEIGLSPSDSSGRELRDYVSTIKLRQTPWNFVPVKFYEFGGTPPPLPGGDEADWNTYAWAQYNPNGLERVDENLPFLDILARSGNAPFVDTPAVRLYVRAGVTGSVGIEFSTPLPDDAFQLGIVRQLNQTALLEVFVNSALRERFTWLIPQPGDLDPIEALIRAVAYSRVIRPARLIVNPSSVERPSFLGANFWLVSTPGAEPSGLLLAKDQKTPTPVTDPA